MSERIFTTGNIAERCQVAPRTVSQWCDSGKLKHYRIPGPNGPGDRRVTRESLVDFLVLHGMPLGDLAWNSGYRLLAVGVEFTLVRRLQETAGLSVRAVPDPFGAGLALSEFRPEALLVDLNAGRSGSLRVAAEAAVRRLPVLGLAAEDEVEFAALRASGFTEVFVRPFDPLAVTGSLLALAGGGR